MMRKPVFAANWKMHLAPSDAAAFVARYSELQPARDDRSILFFPSAVALTSVVEATSSRADLGVGVQNIHWEEKGAFTGELSAEMAKSAGASYVLVGHSERRHVFGETEDQTSRKCGAAFRAGLIPVLCVGETLEQHEAAETEDTVLRQLRAALTDVGGDDIGRMLIAYEPVWAIGTGRTATPEDASRVHAVIRGALKELAPGHDAEVPVLYGGSVSPDNARSLLDAPGVDGLLVGGASLDPGKWTAIVGT